MAFKSMLSGHRWEDLFKCIICGKPGRYHKKGEVFSPKVLLVMLCEAHWGMWKDCIFRIPIRSRHKFLVEVRAKLRAKDRDHFRQTFQVIWDSMPHR